MEQLNHAKTAQEKIILDHFRKAFHLFPKGRLIKSESPDFILKTSPKYAIGIELTSLPGQFYSITNENISIFFSDINLAINKKEGKLKSYRKKKADEYWLIIHADSIISGSLNLNNHLGKFSVCSGFDRIFLHSLIESAVSEIGNQKSEIRNA